MAKQPPRVRLVRLATRKLWERDRRQMQNIDTLLNAGSKASRPSRGDGKRRAKRHS